MTGDSGCQRLRRRPAPVSSASWGWRLSGRGAFLAAIDPDLTRQPAHRPERLAAGDRDPQGRQHRVPARSVRGDCHPGDRFGGAVDEPGHPRCGQLALHVDFDGHVLVVALPRRVAVRRRALPEHVVSTAGGFPTLQPGPLAAGQVPADRPVQRGERGHRGSVRIVGRPLYQLGVDSGGVTAPQCPQPPDFRGDREMGRLHPCEAVILPGSGQPAPHRPLRLPQRLCHQAHMRGAQLTATVEVQQPGHCRRPARRRRKHGLRAVLLMLATASRPRGPSRRVRDSTACCPGPRCPSPSSPN